MEQKNRIPRIAAIPGDGIGTEVIEAGLTVLSVLEKREAFRFEVERFDWGSDHYLRHGRMMPADGLERIRGLDAILFGSAGDPRVPDHVRLWGLRPAVCQGLEQYANVRPTRYRRRVVSGKSVSVLVVPEWG